MQAAGGGGGVAACAPGARQRAVAAPGDRRADEQAEDGAAMVAAACARAGAAMLREPPPQRRARTVGERVRAHAHDASAGARQAARFAALEEEVHASLRPVHAAVAFGKPATAAVGVRQPPEQFVEPNRVGDSVRRGLRAQAFIRLSQANTRHRLAVGSRRAVRGRF